MYGMATEPIRRIGSLGSDDGSTFRRRIVKPTLCSSD
jgi:hypothetical protein